MRRTVALWVFAIGLLCALPGHQSRESCAAPGNARKDVPEARAIVRWEDNLVTVTGRGRIVGSGARGRLLARRAALTDARRNLLLLREDLLNGPRTGTLRRFIVSGRIRALDVHSERTEGAFYVLELDMPLDMLLQ